MQPQGAGPLNAAYFDSLTQQVNQVKTSAELQKLTDGLLPSLEANTSAINAQVAAFAPMLALLTPPTSPTAVVTWATDFITKILTPQLKPAITYATQAPLTLAATANLTAAIASASDRVANATITPPILP